MWTDEGRADDGAFGSGELKKPNLLTYLNANLVESLNILISARLKWMKYYKPSMHTVYSEWLFSNFIIYAFIYFSVCVCVVAGGGGGGGVG